MAILADDLTGALDAAAAFASPAYPVEIVWSDRSPGAEVGYAIDSETRDAPAAEAEEAVARVLPRLLAGGIRYKKIDSLLRGNTIAEIAVCSRSTAFASVVVAPAFPAQMRITRQGCQYAGTPAEWRQVGPSIGDGLQALAVSSRWVRRGERIIGGGVLVCDAESEEDLAAIAGSGAELASPVLWCGSAGLARALAGRRHPVALPRGRSALALIGSRHEISRAQVRRLAEAFPQIVVKLASPCGVEDAVAALAASLGAHGRAALAFELPGLSRADAETVFGAVSARIVNDIAPPDLLVIGGGDTLMRFAVAVGATQLVTVGEWRSGIPLSRFPDGLWQGTAILSKSGGFGGEETLIEAFDNIEGHPQ